MAQQIELLPPDPNEAALVLARAAEEDVPAAAWPRQLADLVDVLVAHFQRRGRPLDDSLEESREIVLAISLYMGGHNVYLPNATVLKTALLHSCIYHKNCRGVSYKTLAIEYGVTVRNIERLVAKQVAFRRHRRQRPLFPELDQESTAF